MCIKYIYSSDFDLSFDFIVSEARDPVRWGGSKKWWIRHPRKVGLSWRLRRHKKFLPGLLWIFLLWLRHPISDEANLFLTHLNTYSVHALKWWELELQGKFEKKYRIYEIFDSFVTSVLCSYPNNNMSLQVLAHKIIVWRASLHRWCVMAVFTHI